MRARQKPSLWLALEAFRASPGAIAAVVLSSAVTLAAQLFAGWWIADVNLLQLQLDPAAVDLTPYDLIGIFAISTLVSLPVTFVPFHVLLERVPLRQAFAASAIAFAENALALVVYGAGTLLLLCFGLLTQLVGLVIALPLSTAAAYAAWKDIFGIREASVA